MAALFGVPISTCFDTLWQWYGRITGYPMPVHGADHNTVIASRETSVLPKKSRSPLFALIIGINKYNSDVPNLEGAVSDSCEVERYLLDELGVPKENIRCLRDEEATRQNIIAGFRALRDDRRIAVDDPILIYYAGHGSTCSTPRGWSVDISDINIQLLVPHDYTGQLYGSDVSSVHGIPDRTIGCLLDEIAQRKGDNITVVFDCCHSTSGTRDIGTSDGSDNHYRIRGFNPHPAVKMTIPSDLDAGILSRGSSNRSFSFASGFLRKGLRSHVLLAACGANEVAREGKDGGLFTCALLHRLKTVGVNKMTYEDLIRTLPSLSRQQSPQCEGYNKNRIIFNSKVTSRSFLFYKVFKNKDGGYQMDAGSIQGITKQAQFAIYPNRDPASPALGVLFAETVAPFFTIMKAPPAQSDIDLGEFGLALQTTAGDSDNLRVHIRSDQNAKDMFKRLLVEMEQSHYANPIHMTLVDIQHAEFCISMENGRVFFSVEDKLPTLSGWRRLPIAISMDVGPICRVIRATAHYFRQLRREDASPKTKLSSRIQVEFFKLEYTPGVYDDDGQAILRPQIPTRDLNSNGVVDLFCDANDDNSDESNLYGIKVINKTSRALYAYVFLFDSDLSIVTYYNPGMSAHNRNADISLDPEGCLTLGYGQAGVSPLAYSLNKDQQIGVAYIKIFLSTEGVDLSFIEQPSPITGNHRGQRPANIKKIALWDTILIPVIYRRQSS